MINTINKDKVGEIKFLRIVELIRFRYILASITNLSKVDMLIAKLIIEG